MQTDYRGSHDADNEGSGRRRHSHFHA